MWGIMIVIVVFLHIVKCKPSCWIGFWFQPSSTVGFGNSTSCLFLVLQPKILYQLQINRKQSTTNRLITKAFDTHIFNIWPRLKIVRDFYTLWGKNWHLAGSSDWVQSHFCQVLLHQLLHFASAPLPWNNSMSCKEFDSGRNTAGGRKLACIQMSFAYCSLCTKWKYLIGSNSWSKSCLGVGWRRGLETSFLSSDPSFSMSPLLGCELAAGFDGALDQKTYQDTIK